MDGEFAPKNVGAVWIADAQDTFVKTLEIWAAKRDKHLVRWRAASAANVVDAVTGATRKSHVEHTSLWDGTDTTGAAMPDGVFRVYVEFTEWNSADSGEAAGPWTVADFVKGPEPVDLLLPDEASFLGKRLVWTP